MGTKIVFALLVTVASISAIAAWSLERSIWNESSEQNKIVTLGTEGWSEISTKLPGRFKDFQFLDEIHGWAITANAIWRTEDGAKTWVQVRQSPTEKVLKNFQPQEILEKLDFVNLSEGWVIEGSSLIHTKDGGVSWEKREIDGVLVRAVSFIDRANGWLAGQFMTLPSRKGDTETFRPCIYGTSDGGGHWQRRYIGPDERYPLWDIHPIFK